MGNAQFYYYYYYLFTCLLFALLIRWSVTPLPGVGPPHHPGLPRALTREGRPERRAPAEPALEALSPPPLVAPCGSSPGLAVPMLRG